jgi:exopolysaccharide production protein ExoZ
MIVFGVLGLEHRRFWQNKFVVLGGDASYAIYLSQVSTMTLLYNYLERLGIDLHSYPSSVLLREVLLLTGAVAIGLMFHIWIERPVLAALRSAVLRAGWISSPMKSSAPAA